MRRYETIFISIADLPDDETSTLIERYHSIVENNKGVVVRVDRWGKRRLAYDIDRHTRGHYVLIDYVGKAEVVNELERNLKIDDKILRFITVKKDDRVDLKAVETEIAAAKEKEASAEQSEKASPASPAEEMAPPLEGPTAS